MRKKAPKRIPRPDHVLSIKQGGIVATYDAEADAAYFRLKKGSVSRTVKLQDWLLVDIDKKGGLLGVEMLFVSHRIPKGPFTTVSRSGKVSVFA